MNQSAQIGKKIKQRRLEVKLTQSEVCGDYMTRNMLSLIEQGRANPSLETLTYLSRVLDIPLPFLLSRDENLFIYEKQEKIGYIRDLFKKANYEACIKLLDSLSSTDDEINYIYAYCSFYQGKKMLHNGSLFTASKLLEMSLEKARATVYNTIEIEATVPLYLAVTTNIQSPLLEFDADSYTDIHTCAFDYEFYKYITQDNSFVFENKLFERHLEAKVLLKKYNYTGAISILLEIEESKNKNYSAPLLFGVYGDLENAYKQIGDFEKAYRYATKRMSLITAFKT